MLFHAIRAETLKLKHSKMILPCACLPLLGLLIGTFNYWANSSVFEVPQWQAYWTQVALFYGYFFYPILLSICASYLWRIEHMNHNWNPLMTAPLSPSAIFAAKFVFLAGISLAVQIFLSVAYFAVGKFFLHFADAFPLQMVISWVLCGWLAALSVSAFQLYLSMRVRSFAVPVGVCLCCCIVGLGCYALGYGRLFPFSLVILGVGSADARQITFGDAAPIVLASGIYAALFFALAIHHLKQADISAT